MVSRAGAVRRPKALRRPSRLASQVFVHAGAVFLGCVFMGPFVWTVGSSLKHVSELQTYPPQLWPKVPQWRNYARIFQTVPYGMWVVNSFVVASLSVLGVVLSCSLAAYSFSRFRYPGREVLFMCVLGTMMLPSEVTLIPTYLLYYYVHWLDSFKPLIVPSFLGGSAFGIFLMRQFFLTLPLDLDEAAKLDGASHFRIYWNIIMPLSRPALATLAVITFIGQWDSFIQPLIFLNTQTKFTLAIGLRYYQESPDLDYSEPTEHLLMGAATMMALPPLLLFFVAQRYFVRGIAMSGIKG